MIKSFSTILLLAGESTRCELGYNKVLHLINKKPVFRYSLDEFLTLDFCKEVVIVCKQNEESIIKKYLPQEFLHKIKITYGGLTRQESVLNGLNAVSEDYVLIHDGARPCIKKNDIIMVLENLENNRAVTLGATITDSLRFVGKDESTVIDRNNVVSIKTPQGVLKNDLLFSLNKAKDEKAIFTDDISAIEKYCNIIPKIVISSNSNIKITKYEDLEMIEKMFSKKEIYKIGHSRDTHRLEKGNKIIIGGVLISCDFQIIAHSDGDVLIHSISEAIIGALGMGDLGKMFSDKDPQYKNISSKYFLEKVRNLLDDKEFEIVNIDSTIFIEKPMMFPFIESMKKNISNCLMIDENVINIKATRGEKVGAIGRSEAVACETVVLIKKI